MWIILACLTLVTVSLIHNIMLCELIYDVVHGIYPTLSMLYLTRDIWHRYLVFTPALCIYTDNWHVTPDIWFMTPALGIYTGTRYLTPIFAMLYLTPIFVMLYLILILAMLYVIYLILILAMLYLTCDTWPRFLSCYTYHLILDTYT